MSYYRTCPDCGAALDPGERCDCQEPCTNREGSQRAQRKTAADAANIDDGVKGNKFSTTCCPSSLSENKEECQV